MSLLLNAIESKTEAKLIAQLLRRGVTQNELDEALAYLIKYGKDEGYTQEIAGLLIKSGANIYQYEEIEPANLKERRAAIMMPLLLVAGIHKRFETVKWLLPYYVDFEKIINENFLQGKKQDIYDVCNAFKNSSFPGPATETKFLRLFKLFSSVWNREKYIQIEWFDFGINEMNIERKLKQKSVVEFMLPLFPDYLCFLPDCTFLEPDSDTYSKFKLYQLAAEAGGKEAAFHLACCYLTGSGVEQSVANAIPHLFAAATRDISKFTRPLPNSPILYLESIARGEFPAIFAAVAPKDSDEKHGEHAETKAKVTPKPAITAEMQSAANLALAKYYAQATTAEERQELQSRAQKQKCLVANVSGFNKEFKAQDGQLQECLAKVAESDKKEHFASLKAFSDIINLVKQANGVKTFQLQLLTDSPEAIRQREFLKNDTEVVDYLYQRLLVDESLVKNLINVLENLALLGNQQASFYVFDALQRELLVIKKLDIKPQSLQQSLHKFWGRSSVLTGNPGEQERYAVAMSPFEPVRGEAQLISSAFFRAEALASRQEQKDQKQSEEKADKRSTAPVDLYWLRANLEVLFQLNRAESPLYRAASNFAALTLYEIRQTEQKSSEQKRAVSKLSAAAETYVEKSAQTAISSEQQELWNQLFNAKCLLQGKGVNVTVAEGTLEELARKVEKMPIKDGVFRFLISLIQIERCIIRYKHLSTKVYVAAYDLLEEVINLHFEASKTPAKITDLLFHTSFLYEASFIFLQQALHHMTQILSATKNAELILRIKNKQFDIYGYYAQSTPFFTQKVKWLRQALGIAKELKDAAMSQKVLDEFTYLVLTEYGHEQFAEHLKTVTGIAAIDLVEQLKTLEGVRDRAPKLLDNVNFLQAQIYESIAEGAEIKSLDLETKRPCDKLAQRTAAAELYLKLIKTDDPKIFDVIFQRLTALQEILADKELLQQIFKFLAVHHFEDYKCSSPEQKKLRLLSAIEYANKLSDRGLHTDYLNAYLSLLVTEKHLSPQEVITTLMADTKHFSLEDCLNAAALKPSCSQNLLVRAKIYFALKQEKEGIESLLDAYIMEARKEAVLPELIAVLNEKSFATESNKELLNKVRKTLVEHYFSEANAAQASWNWLVKALDLAKQIGDDKTLYQNVINKIVYVVLFVYGYAAFSEQLIKLQQSSDSPLGQAQEQKDAASFIKSTEIINSLQYLETSLSTESSPFDKTKLSRERQRELLAHNLFLQATIYQQLAAQLEEQSDEGEVKQDRTTALTHQTKAAECLLAAYAKTSGEKSADKSSPLAIFRGRITDQLIALEKIIQDENVLRRVRWCLVELYIAKHLHSPESTRLLQVIQLARELNEEDLYSKYLNEYIKFLLIKKLNADDFVNELVEAAKAYEFDFEDCLKMKVLTSEMPANRSDIYFIIAKIYLHLDKKEEAAKWLLNCFNFFPASGHAFRIEIMKKLVELEKVFAAVQSELFNDIRATIINDLLEKAINTPSRDLLVEAVLIARRNQKNPRLLTQVINTLVEYLYQQENFFDLVQEEKALTLPEVLAANCLKPENATAKVHLNRAFIFKNLKDFRAAANSFCLVLDKINEFPAGARAGIIARCESEALEDEMSEFLLDPMFNFYCKEKNAQAIIAANAETINKLKQPTLDAICRLARELESTRDETTTQLYKLLAQANHPEALFKQGQWCEKAQPEAKIVEAVDFYLQAIKRASQDSSTYAKVLKEAFQQIARLIRFLKEIEKEHEVKPFAKVNTSLQGLCENEAFLKNFQLVTDCFNSFSEERGLLIDWYQRIVKFTRQPKVIALPATEGAGLAAEQNKLEIKDEHTLQKSAWPARAWFALAKLHEKIDEKQATKNYRAAFDVADEALRKEIFDRAQIFAITVRDREAGLELLQICFDYFDPNWDYDRLISTFSCIKDEFLYAWYERLLSEFKAKKDFSPSYELCKWLTKIRWDLAKLHEKSDEKQAIEFYREACDTAVSYQKTLVLSSVWSFIKSASQNSKAALLLIYCKEYEDEKRYDVIVNAYEEMKFLAEDPELIAIIAKAYHQAAKRKFAEPFGIGKTEALRLLEQAKKFNYLPAFVTHAEWDALKAQGNLYSKTLCCALTKPVEEAVPCILQIFELFIAHPKETKEEQQVAEQVVAICKNTALLEKIIATETPTGKGEALLGSVVFRLAERSCSSEASSCCDEIRKLPESTILNKVIKAVSGKIADTAKPKAAEVKATEMKETKVKEPKPSITATPVSASGFSFLRSRLGSFFKDKSATAPAVGAGSSPSRFIDGGSPSQTPAVSVAASPSGQPAASPALPVMNRVLAAAIVEQTGSGTPVAVDAVASPHAASEESKEAAPVFGPGGAVELLPIYRT